MTTHTTGVAPPPIRRLPRWRVSGRRRRRCTTRAGWPSPAPTPMTPTRSVGCGWCRPPRRRSGRPPYEFWGLDDTAAGLPNADQLGDLVAVPQRGLPKTVDPARRAGRRRRCTTSYGTPLCQQIDGGNWTCTTFDVTRRPVDPHGAGQPGRGGAGDDHHRLRPGRQPVDQPHHPHRRHRRHHSPTRRCWRRRGGSSSTPTPSNTTTGYALRRDGPPGHHHHHPAGHPGPAGPAPPVGRVTAGFTYTHRSTRRPACRPGSRSRANRWLAIAYDNPDHPWLPTGYTYTLTGGATVTAEVNYDSDLNPFGRTWTFADGSTPARLRHHRGRPRRRAPPPSVTPSRARRPAAASWPAASTATPTSSPTTPPAASPPPRSGPPATATRGTPTTT